MKDGREIPGQNSPGANSRIELPRAEHSGFWLGQNPRQNPRQNPPPLIPFKIDERGDKCAGMLVDEREGGQVGRSRAAR